MSIWCELFGHKSTGYEGGTPYGKLYAAGSDGIGRKHGYVRVVCDRCEEQYRICNVHEWPEDLRAKASTQRVRGR